ncbi:MAG TPA: ABC transporter ATP-binding protein [Spirochaetota bacterium]|nr:ABC transporter ATP-binding protein [Spirochaetota bacterium]HPF06691.1 ABC transporter ATP-binding protein [Spirochaetota bacterium]HPJ42743.1 ABC transporter ATP-binding protein [Spirochaetota bacterium]HPR38215.1 ABC transporter ATP-binding protein [Spirochaetota bacterium]HRX48724.1 ABC transporter ATP-binding protein [Spirochaetota bacterium]
MLKAEKITKKFKRQTVLLDACIEVNSEIKALIGINGSGKSTFLKIIAGIVNPDQGSIMLNGADICHLPPEKRNLGYVPQHPALFRHLSIRENVLYGMRNGKGTIEAFERIVEMLDLKDVLDKKPRELSGGYKSRASLARALVPEPGILLMDEPLNGMDIVLREKLLPVFRSVLKELNIPVLYVTHDPKEAELLADSYAIIDNGTVISVNSSEQAFGMIRSSILKKFE